MINVLLNSQSYTAAASSVITNTPRTYWGLNYELAIIYKVICYWDGKLFVPR